MKTRSSKERATSNRITSGFQHIAVGGRIVTGNSFSETFAVIAAASMNQKRVEENGIT
jgi:hypothetical protein